MVSLKHCFAVSCNMNAEVIFKADMLKKPFTNPQIFAKQV